MLLNQPAATPWPRITEPLPRDRTRQPLSGRIDPILGRSALTEPSRAVPRGCGLPVSRGHHDILHGGAALCRRNFLSLLELHPGWRLPPAPRRAAGPPAGSRPAPNRSFISLVQASLGKRPTISVNVLQHASGIASSAKACTAKRSSLMSRTKRGSASFAKTRSSARSEMADRTIPCSSQSG